MIDGLCHKDVSVRWSVERALEHWRAAVRSSASAQAGTSPGSSPERGSVISRSCSTSSSSQSGEDREN